MNERHFKYSVKVNYANGAIKTPFVDWYSGVDEAAARELLLEDMHRYGINPEDATITVQEVAALP